MSAEPKRRSLSRVAIAGALWSAVLQWSRVGIGAVVFLLLSRLLTLDEVGIFAALQAPILFLQTFQRAVIPDAVVQEEQPSGRHLSTLHLMSLISGLLFFLALGLGGFWIEEFLDYPGAALMLWALSVSPLFLAASAVYEGVMRRNFRLKALAARTGITTCIAAVPAVIMGYAGYGAWALVTYTLVTVALSSILTIVMSSWSSRIEFDYGYARSSMPRLWALMGRYAVSAAVVPLLQTSITVQLGTASGGVFQIGQRLLSLVDSLIGVPMKYVALPLFARTSADPERFRAGLLAGSVYGVMIASPIYLGLSAIAPLLLPLALADNGATSVTAFQYLCFYGPAGLVNGLIAQALVSKNQAGLVFRRAVVMAFCAVVPCVIMTFFSIEHVAAAYAIFGGYLGLLPTLFLLDRFCGVKPGTYVRSVVRPFGAALAMAGCVALAANWIDSAHGALVTALGMTGLVLAGMLLYVFFLRMVCRDDLLALFRSLRRKAD